MPTHLFVAPAGSGKTAYVLEHARKAARELRALPLVLLPGEAQIHSFRQRIAQIGGALGVQVTTFGGLYRAILSQASATIIPLTDPVRQRVLRVALDALKDQGQMAYYEPLRQRPGFVGMLGDLIRELKLGMISPSALRQAWTTYPASSPRLEELATIYASYQQHLAAQDWADNEGLGWLAVEALRRDDRLGRSWPLILVDGFDSYNTLQTCMLAALAQRAHRMIITLTGDAQRPSRPLAHRRFARTRSRLEQALGCHAEPLPSSACGMSAALCHIESSLFEHDAHPWQEVAPIELLEAPDRSAEAREALRWCRERIVHDGMTPSDLAIVARDLEPYRPYVMEAAREFGVPVRLSSGLPLRDHLVIAALMGLLKLFAPAPDGSGPALPRRLVVEAWHSPYFDWGRALRDAAGAPIAIEAGDAELLDDAARQGQVIAGWEQWRDALQRLAQERSPDDDEEVQRPRRAVQPSQALALWRKLQAFVERLTPPAHGSTSDYIAWLSDLIGADLALEPDEAPNDRSLGVIGRIRQEQVAAPDGLMAIKCFTDILHSLAWAEQLGGVGSISYGRFLAEIQAAVEISNYQMPASPNRHELLIANVFDVRGLSFRAIALLGLAEGEFPLTLREDPLLRDEDRLFLQEQGLGIDARLDSDEGGYFYEAVTRAREKLLLTRPRQAEDGSLWQPSPYWDEMRRLAPTAALRRSRTHAVSGWLVASLEELLEWQAGHSLPGCDAWLQRHASDHWQAVLAGAQVLAARSQQRSPSEYEGDLSHVAAAFAQRYGSHHVWSASSIESYRACPFLFFVSRVLGLEPRALPNEGYDMAQRGLILHRIIELVHAAAQDKRNGDELLGLLPTCAESVLASAPEQYGFRPTAWWQATCQELVDRLRRNITALNTPDILARWTPRHFEVRFGFGADASANNGPLIVRCGDEEIRLHGVIDRVDTDPDGNLRVIDYKSGGSSDYGRQALEKGKKLQLAIYALAARDALALGEPTEGFYWHLASAESSGLKLGDYGMAEAFEQASACCAEAVRGVRTGLFPPQPADSQCPAWCPAASFCWRLCGPAY